MRQAVMTRGRSFPTEYFFVQWNFAQRLSAFGFRNWRVMSNNLINFSCPVCGDSKRSAHRARAFLYTKENKLNFVCHNCGSGMSFRRFLRLHVSESLYKEYIATLYTFDPQNEVKIEDSVETKTFAEFPEGLQAIADSPLALKYLKWRKLPDEWIDELYFCSDSISFAKTYDKEFSEHVHTFPAIAIPFKDRFGNVIAWQLRNLNANSKLRYWTFKTKSDNIKVFGLHKNKRNHDTFVFEGPFDSMFIPNAIAAAGSDLSRLVDATGIPAENMIFVLDNEPRKHETVEKLKKLIDNNYRVVIWEPESEGKDINKMVQDGKSPEDIVSMLKRRTFKGLRAGLEFGRWKKI